MTRRIQCIVLAAVSAGIVASAVAEQPAGVRSVFWQVVYADGKVRDLDHVPTTRANIQWVERVVSEDTGQKGYEVLSTGEQTMVDVPDTITTRTQLRWNGRAWVAPRPKPMPAVDPTLPGAAPTSAPTTGPAGMQIDDITAVIQRELGQSQQKLRDLETQLDQARRDVTDTKAAARRKALAAQIAECQRRIDALQAAARDPAWLKPIGRLGSASQPAALKEGDTGLAKPIGSVAVVPQHVQVWRAPKAAGEGPHTYTVEMAHPEAGQGGAFYYVAYADTDGDGKPDKLIARSPLAQADQPGDWTNWSFSTADKTVYIGNTMLPGDTSVYYAPDDGAVIDNGSPAGGNEIFVSGCFGSTPNTPVGPGNRWGVQPYITNIRMHISANPAESGAANDGIRILTRERE